MVVDGDELCIDDDMIISIAGSVKAFIMQRDLNQAAL